ncbi:MAG: hypothetical protein QME68_06390, partial [Elusimicrobiota bacterium]|nr:hypothetical protein [Elusimicrobiota bacterium]
KNSSSMYIEIAYRKENKPDVNSTVKKTILQLKKCKILWRTDKISSVNILPINYAYIIYNRNRNEAVGKIQKYLQKNCVYSIGRFGAWKYSYIEESILDGRATADLLSFLTVKSGAPTRSVGRAKKSRC